MGMLFSCELRDMSTVYYPGLHCRYCRLMDLLENVPLVDKGGRSRPAKEALRVSRSFFFFSLVGSTQCYDAPLVQGGSQFLAMLAALHCLVSCVDWSVVVFLQLINNNK